MDPPQMTTDGYDLQFGTNVLGYWYLTEPPLRQVRRAQPTATRASLRRAAVARISPNLSTLKPSANIGTGRNSASAFCTARASLSVTVWYRDV